MKSFWDVPFRYFTLTLLIIFILAGIWYIREIFQPLLTAALIAYFLSPAVNFLSTRFRLQRKLAANLVYFLVLALLIALPLIILPIVLGEIQGILSDFDRALDGLQFALQEPIRLGNMRIYLSGLLSSLRQNMNSGIVPRPEDAIRILESTSRNFLWLLVTLVSAYYLMTDWTRLRHWLIQLAPPEEQPNLDRLYREIRKIWLDYLNGQVRLIVILALMYSLAWWAIGLPGAPIIGTLAGVLNLLPEIGPASAAILATLLAFLEGSLFLPVSNLWFALITLGVYLLLNNFKTIWLQPRILGHSVLLHEGLVFVAIVTAIILWGALGVLIIVPLLATIGVLGRYLRRRLLGLPPFDDPTSASLPTSQPGAAPQAESNPSSYSA
ncbi:MAG: AI-2E family transporter [Anaerolineae bacterium]